MIIALAGRRVDPVDTDWPQFPLKNLDRVGAAFRMVLKAHGATAVVCSAACGADLIGLSEAGQLSLRRRIVLPFGRDKFRGTSVVNCPGEWGKLYDSILDEVEASGDLVVIDTGNEDNPYSATNRAILEEGVA